MIPNSAFLTVVIVSSSAMFLGVFGQGADNCVVKCLSHNDSAQGAPFDPAGRILNPEQTKEQAYAYLEIGCRKLLDVHYCLMNCPTGYKFTTESFNKFLMKICRTHTKEWKTEVIDCEFSNYPEFEKECGGKDKLIEIRAQTSADTIAKITHALMNVQGPITPEDKKRINNYCQASAIMYECIETAFNQRCSLKARLLRAEMTLARPSDEVWFYNQASESCTKMENTIHDVKSTANKFLDKNAAVIQEMEEDANRVQKDTAVQSIGSFAVVTFTLAVQLIQ